MTRSNMRKISKNEKVLVFMLLVIGLAVLLFADNIYLSISISLVILGIILNFVYTVFFYYALVLLIVSPIFWILGLENITETLINFVFFFIFTGVLGELFFTIPEKKKE